jgi:hypothetical protein
MPHQRAPRAHLAQATHLAAVRGQRSVSDVVVATVLTCLRHPIVRSVLGRLLQRRSGLLVLSVPELQHKHKQLGYVYMRRWLCEPRLGRVARVHRYLFTRRFLVMRT